MNLSISFYDRKMDNAPKPQPVAWETLVGLLTRHTTRATKDGSLWSPAQIAHGKTRLDANVVEVCCLVADIDDKTPFTEFEPRLRGLAYAYHSSYNSTATEPKYRVVLPLLRPVSAAEWPSLHRRLAMALFEGHADPSCSDRSRMYYLPSCPKQRLTEAFGDYAEGEFLDPDDLERYPEPEPENVERATPHKDRTADWEGDRVSGNHLVDCALDKIKTLKGRNDGGLWLACQLRDNGYSEIESVTYLCDYAKRAPHETGKDSYTEGEALKSLASAFKRQPREPWTKPGIESPALNAWIEKNQKAKAAQEEGSPDAQGDTSDAFMADADLPEIVLTNQQDRDIASASWQAIFAANKPPRLFARGRNAARVAQDADSGRVVLEMVDENRLLHRLRRVADYKTRQVVKSKDPDVPPKVVFSHATPPVRIARDMLCETGAIAQLPNLRAVVYAPVVGAAGELITEPGYDEGTRLYLATGDLSLNVNRKATRKDACAAYHRLFGADGVFSEFPFVDVSAAAHALAMLLTPFVRPYINATAPMIIVEAPEKGTGKSLLARNLLRVSDPIPHAWDAPAARHKEDAEAEWSKVLVTALKDGPSVLFLDNVRGALASTALESLITSPDPWSQRILGGNTEITVWPTLLTIVATSNNAEANRDMVRRSISIRLDANEERPETRNTFRIKDLDTYVEANRAAIISDVLTILAAWINAGRPEQTAVVKGGFERWCRVVGGILAFLVIPGFLADEEDRAATLDPESARWSAFLAKWYEKHKSEGKKAADLSLLAAECEIISDATNVRGLGSLLKKNRDRVFGDNRLESAGEDRHTKVFTYKVIPAKSKSAGFAGFAGSNPNATREPYFDKDNQLHIDIGVLKRDREMPPQTPQTPQDKEGADSNIATTAKHTSSFPDDFDDPLSDIADDFETDDSYNDGFDDPFGDGGEA